MVELLSKDKILQADDLPLELVEVPEWGGSVYVRGLTGYERDSFEASIMEQKGSDYKVNLVNARAKLVITTVVDEKGERLFQDKDLSKLSKKSAIALNRLFEVAQRLSGLTAKDVEELAKN